MSEQEQDTTSRLSTCTSDTVRQTSENASNTSKPAPKTAEEIHELSPEELDNLYHQTFSECQDEKMTGTEYGVNLKHPLYATFRLVQIELQERKTLRVSQGGAVLNIHAR
jgi:hypothetical protein